VQKAAGADGQAALGSARLEAPAATRPGVAGGGAWACPARLTGWAGHGTILEAHEAAVGPSHVEARGGAGGAGGVSVVLGPALAMPEPSPALGGEGRQQAGGAHGFFAARAGEG